MRQRALDTVSPDQWQKSNPLFVNAEKALADAFERGVRHDLTYYVTRPSSDGKTLEEQFAQAIADGDARSKSRLRILRGSVGTGKSCFVRYVCECQLPATAPSVLPLYIDTHRRVVSTKRTGRPLVNRFLEAASEIAIRRGLFANYRDYLHAVFMHLGFSFRSDAALFRQQKSLHAQHVVKFLLAQPSVHSLFVVIDNIDEGPRGSIENADAFAHQLLEAGTSGCTVLLPMRRYTANRFTDTKRYHVDDLPAVSEHAVIRSALRHASTEVGSSQGPIVIDFSFTTRRGRDVDIGSRKVSISVPSGLVQLLDLLSHQLLEREVGARKLLSDLANGNLKILVSNMFNLLQSSKLPLLPLTEQLFMPASATQKRERGSMIPDHLALECLMAVRYPFFDVDMSHVPNVFRVRESHAPHDFQNTLTIPRLLGLLSNLRQHPLGAIVKRMTACSYSKTYINAAIEKCLGFGLLESDHGISLEQLDSRSLIAISRSGRLFAEHLMYEPAYLILASEDTEMTSDHIVPIDRKYPVSGSHGDRAQRLRSARRLIAFLEAEERLEERAIESRIPDTEVFRRDFFVEVTGRRPTLHERMVDETEPRLKRMEAE